MTEDYERLTPASRKRLAADMARFYAELHALDESPLRAAGAGPVAPWLAPEAILGHVAAILSRDLLARAERIVDAWQALPPEPGGTVFGFFDGHGWNMAFDHDRERLNGIYDFGDSGFGPLHQEFVYTDFVGPDLTERVVDEYESLTCRALDRRRIRILAGALMLSELAGEIAADGDVPVALQAYRDWAARSSAP